MKAKFIKYESYLCAIGTITTEDKTDEYAVGVFDGTLFSFRNGSYSDTMLDFRKNIGSSITTVLKAKLIDDIDF